MNTNKIGLLPFYLKLYDDNNLRDKKRVDGFYKLITQEFQSRDLEVVASSICRTAEEFQHAVDVFEESDAVAIVTLHLAYSPSLESIDALSSTYLPIIVCDTTPTYNYGPTQNPEEMMFNHGIHGVQDMCNLLLRRGKRFHIEAGHWEKSDVLNRVTGRIKSAGMLAEFRNRNLGLIGTPFDGMGDFYVSEQKLNDDFNIRIKKITRNEYQIFSGDISAQDILDELKSVESDFLIDEEVAPDTLKRSVRTHLVIKKWIEQHEIKAFSFNFLDITPESGFDTIPFLSASLLMAEGIGYGGEGDLLTAALVHSLMSVYPETSFAEMFCADWAGESIYLSHMGEFNHSLSEGKSVLFEMDYNFSNVANPVYPAGRFKPGSITIVDLLPMAEGYRLIIASAEMISIDPDKDRMNKSVHGWFKPQFNGGCISTFLEEYSKLGGTHHIAVVYTEETKTIERFGELMGFEVIKL